MAAASASLSAADVFWVSATDGGWSVPGNWSTITTIPTAADAVTIGATSGANNPYTVGFGSGLTAFAQTVALGAAGQPRAVLNMTGGTLTVDTGAGSTADAMTMNNSDLVIGSGATLNLWTSDTASTTGRSSLRMQGNSTVTVSGTLSSATAGGGLSTGTNAGLRMAAAAGATNTFTVASGGVASFGFTSVGSSDAGSNAAGQNHVVVDGGSLTLRALELGRNANAGNATVTVKNGGTFNTGGSGASIGGGTGVSGQGTLTIGEAGGVSSGTVTSDVATFFVGHGNANGTGIITLHAGSLTVNSMVLGNSTTTSAASTSKGTLNINGGTFTARTTGARTISVGGQNNSSGEFNISGGVANITRTQGDSILQLAHNVTTGVGTGVLNITGGELNVDKFKSETAAGTINFSDGLFTVKQATVNNGKVFTVGDGTGAAIFRLVDGTGSGTHTFANGLSIAANARLDGTGVVGSATTIGGTISSTNLSFSSGITFLSGSTIDLSSGGIIAVTGGDLTIANGASVNVTGASFVDGGTYTLFSIVGTTPDLSQVNFNVAGFSSAGSWVGSQFQLALSTAPIPEASTYGFWLGGAALAFVAGRRRSRS